MEANNDNLAADVLKGAAEIAAFLGEDTRSIFYMISKGVIPHYRMGESIRARKSALRDWVAKQEAQAGAAA